MVCSAVNDERDVSKAAAAAAAVAVALSTASPAVAISALLEGTDTARLIEEAQVSKKKPAAASAKAAVKTAPVPKTAAPGAQYPKPGNAKAENAALRLPEVKVSVPEPTKAAKPAPVTKANVKVPKPAVGKPSAPVLPKKSTAAKPVAVKPAGPELAVVKTAPIPKTPGGPRIDGKQAKANLPGLKVEAPTAQKGGKGMQLAKEAAKTRLEKCAAAGGGGDAGLAGLLGAGKAAGKAAAAKGAAGKAAAAATQGDALEAAAVVVAGGAVGQTGTSIITKNSRIRKIRVTPKGELPLPVQMGLALALPASFLFTLISFLAYL